MILLVDAGNSLTKWTTAMPGVAPVSGSFPTADRPSWRTAGSTAPDAAVVSCVAGVEVLEGIRLESGLDAERFHVLVPKRNAHAIVNGYADPAQLGPDRYAALIAAHRRGLGDCVVVGAGTALTADMLTRDGRFLGGCIVPGPALMRASLAASTDRIRAMTGGAMADLPRDTASAVATGIALALCGVVEGMGRRLQSATGREVTVIAGGGARSLLMPCLDRPVVEVENLVLEGLAWVARDLGYAV